MTDKQIDDLLLSLHKKAESVDCMWGLPIFSEPAKSEFREIVKRHIDKSIKESIGDIFERVITQ